MIEVKEGQVWTIDSGYNRDYREDKLTITYFCPVKKHFKAKETGHTIWSVDLLKVRYFLSR